MARSKATMSRDGVHRITLRVRERVDLDAVAFAIAMASYEDAETIANAGRTRLLGWARDGLRDFGFDHLVLGDADGYDAEIAAARPRLVELEIFPAESEDARHG